MRNGAWSAFQVAQTSQPGVGGVAGACAAARQPWPASSASASARVKVRGIAILIRVARVAYADTERSWTQTHPCMHRCWRSGCSGRSQGGAAGRDADLPTRMAGGQARALAEDLVAQAAFLVMGAIAAAPLQFRHDVGHYVGHAVVRHGEGQIKTVDA